MNKIFLSVSLHVIKLNAVLERDEPWQCNSQDEKLIPDERHSSKIKNNALLQLFFFFALVILLSDSYGVGSCYTENILRIMYTHTYSSCTIIPLVVKYPQIS